MNGTYVKKHLWYIMFDVNGIDISYVVFVFRFMKHNVCKPDNSFLFPFGLKTW